jgi:phage portal protein BeeE
MDVPMGLLRDTRTDGDNLTQTETDEILAKWRTARAQYGTGFLGKSLDYTPVQFNAQQLQLIEARQHQAVEIARLMNLTAGAVNAPDATGMTYKNGEAERRALRDTTLAHYLTAIAQRLSMPDVTPEGQRVDFDTSKWLRGDASEAVTSAVEACGGPVLTVDEARAQFLDRTPMVVEAPPAPAVPEIAPLIPAPKEIAAP